MKRITLTGVLMLAASVYHLSAQQAPAGQQAPPAGKGGQAGQSTPAAPPTPTPEQKAVQAMIAAQRDMDALIQAADDLVTNFPNSQYKELALTLQGQAYRQKGDPVKSQIAFERVLAVNPKNIAANLILGELITQQAKEKDLDLADKLGVAERFLKTALDLLDGPNPNPALPEEQWQAARKAYAAEAHNAFGMIALLRKDHDVAVTEFQTAAGMENEPAYSVRLAHALNLAGKNAECIAVCDKLLSDPQANLAIKDLVTKVRNNAMAASKPISSPRE